MPLELWLAYVATSAVVLAIPGPTILLVLSFSIAHGRKATLPVVAGVALFLSVGRRGLLGGVLDDWFGITLPFTMPGVVLACKKAMEIIISSRERPRAKPQIRTFSRSPSSCC